ncbi:MAG TPA: SGNH/GDSL hydrolase family protein [Dongiaceae bacterium]|nr:SGNH/GDSL hydrolase family protein [Dongiaceae bacterium]
MPHIVLLGDSILDNRCYTAGGPDVISQVKALLPKAWRASLLAVDGSTATDVPGQMRQLPTDASHLVLSVGGNDAIMNSGMLNKPIDLASEAIAELAEIAEGFEFLYREAIRACQKANLPLCICTIYNGNFPDPAYQRLASTALMAFNDVILRVGIGLALAIIDLRLICTAPEDYANPIEPSSVGGVKIARAIVSWACDDARSRPRSEVIAG